MGFPGGSIVKCLECGRSGFDPWVRKIPWRRKWQPTPVLLPGKSSGQRSLKGCSSWGRKESDSTERLSPEKAMAPHSSTLAWRIPGTGEPTGLPSMGLHRVGHDWSDLAAAAAEQLSHICCAGCRILVPQPGNEHGATAVILLSTNHWTTKEFPCMIF